MGVTSSPAPADRETTVEGCQRCSCRPVVWEVCCGSLYEKGMGTIVRVCVECMRPGDELKRRLE